MRTIAFVAPCLLVVACGGSDDSSSAANEPTSDEGSADAAPKPKPKPKVVCPDFSVDEASSTVEIRHDGLDRTYLLHVPKGVGRKSAVPLLLNYHGLTSNASQQRGYSGFDTVADREGFVVAYPEGIKKSFNAGSCCQQMTQNDADDGGFARAIVADISKKVCIDPSRVYSTGMSNGGYMSEYNACVNADIFAAIAPVSALAQQQPVCKPSRPVSMITFNGTEDPLANYEGAQKSIAEWVDRDGCKGKPSREKMGDSYCDTWDDCKADVVITACTITGMNHCWPGVPITIPGYCKSGGLEDIDATEMAWEFLSKYTLP